MQPRRAFAANGTVHRLATYRGEPILSTVYLDVDGAHRPAAAEYRGAFECLADDLRRRSRARDDHRVGEAVEGDIVRMSAYLSRGIDRTTTRGIAMYACHQQDWFEAISFPVSVRDQAAIGVAPHIRQLLEVLDDPEPFLVVLVDSVHMRVIRVDGQTVHERAALVSLRERGVDTSGQLGSFEHHEEEVVRAHLRRAAAAVDDAVRRSGLRGVVIGGPTEAIAGLEHFLHAATRELIIGRVGSPVSAPADVVAADARAVADQEERRREVALVEDVRQRAAGAHGGVIGLEASLATLAERRVATLLVAAGFEAPGACCPACGRVGPALRQCPDCGTTNVEVDDVIELAIEQAVAQDADVEFCRDTDLERFGSIAAIARY